ncbi:hypothetical protein L6164_033399 [Bauhinia variegata]|uniref:Uncharacterized protein n=1 Tax=Bauhinia variegata TaxID=167791 RepID=A0ACB9KRK3_BAUVA|nr:hypothetical protein L6164_033399 [Bauhinia variegata]
MTTYGFDCYYFCRSYDVIPCGNHWNITERSKEGHSVSLAVWTHAPNRAKGSKFSKKSQDWHRGVGNGHHGTMNFQQGDSKSRMGQNSTVASENSYHGVLEALKHEV